MQLSMRYNECLCTVLTLEASNLGNQRRNFESMNITLFHGNRPHTAKRHSTCTKLTETRLKCIARRNVLMVLR